MPINEDGGSREDSSLVVCFVEMLIDFVPTVPGVSLAETPAFEKAPGGAPANVAACIARLGGSSGFIGKILYLRHMVDPPSLLVVMDKFLSGGSNHSSKLKHEKALSEEWTLEEEESNADSIILDYFRCRISITFRKMDECKLPYNYLHDPELMNIKPLLFIPMMKLQVQQNQNKDEEIIHGGPRLL